MSKQTITTLELGEHMLKTGRFYTASALRKELGISIVEATSRLYNIKHSKKYRIQLHGKPVKVKVVDINGRAEKANLWETVLQSSWS